MERKPIGRRTLLVGSSAVATGFIVGTVIAEDPPSNSDCDLEVALIADRTEPIGTVCVWAEVPDLQVTYSTEGDWELTETNLAVGDDLHEFEEEGWTNPRGHPRPGRFPYGETHEPPTDATSHLISFDDFTPFEWPVIIAAHAHVEHTISDESNQETAWGDGERFVERGSWAMYFEFDGSVFEITVVGDTTAGGVN